MPRTDPSLHDAQHAAPTSAARSVGSRRNQAQARAQVLRTLTQDHQLIRRAMRDALLLEPRRQAVEQQRAIARVCRLLRAHAGMEEAVFYRAAREALPDAALVLAAEVEHRCIDLLLDELMALPAGHERTVPTFTVLADHFRHHVKEEEGKLFRSLAGARVDWGTVLEDMQAQRLESQFDPSLGDTPEVPALPPPSHAAGGRAAASPSVS